MSRSPEDWEEMRQAAITIRRLLRQVAAIADDWPPNFDETADHARDLVELSDRAIDKANEMIGMLTHDFND